MKKLIIVGLFAACIGIVGLKNSSAQAITQVAYSSATEASRTVGATAVKLDLTKKNDRRLLILQNVGSVEAWCAFNSAPTTSAGFQVTGTSTTLTAGNSVPNMLSLNITADVSVWCIAASGTTTTFRISQLR